MASSVNANVSTSIYCQACGAINPAQATHCFACGQPLSPVTGGTGATTNPLTGLLLSDVIIHQRYRILEVLSAGEVSTVYKAQDIQFGKRVVALKEIGQNQQSTQKAQDAAELIEAGKREMLLLASLIHPNLPRIYEYFVENQRWYFVMDFLEGETLEAYLGKRKNRALPVEEVLDSGIQLATVLDYLHLSQSPLGLKDLKMSSIWRTPDGKLYLLDTGMVPPAAAMSQSRSVYSLGRILRRLQAGKKSLRSSKAAEALQARAVFAAQTVNPADDPQGCTQKAIHEPGDDQTGIATARTTTPRDRANSYTAPEETPLISPLAVENGRTRRARGGQRHPGMVGGISGS